MTETVYPLSRQDRIREAYGRAVGDHDYSSRGITDYHTTKDLLPVIRAAVTDVTLTSTSTCSITIPAYRPWGPPTPSDHPTPCGARQATLAIFMS